MWRAAADTAERLIATWGPGKPGTGAIAALQSLRPVDVDVRVEAPDGRAAARTLTRRIVADGVRPRRWRDGLAATLHLPAPAAPPVATLLLDATTGPDEAAVAGVAAPLLASRGVLVLAVRGGDLAAARERLAAVPVATPDVAEVRAAAPGEAAAPAGVLLVPPGVPARDDDRDAAAARASAWDDLLARLGATPRATVDGAGTAAD